MPGPTLPVSIKMYTEKYCEDGENFEKAITRVAKALRDDTPHYKAFREITMDMRFMPGGRIQSAMGATREVTAWNCFVAPTIEDTFVDGDNSIMDVATKAAATLRQGGGLGYDFSTLRPRNDIIRKLGSKSSGPIAFMEIFDAVCRTAASAGHRRGAQMGVLRVDHPDIEAFIAAKQNSTYLTGFNLSVGITDEFMDVLAAGKTFWLTFGGRRYREVDARELWDKIMASTWDWAEPGVLFIDRMNEMNNLWYCEKITATNPCGEQPLPPNGACLLGSFNLARYVNVKTKTLDLTQLRKDVPHVVRAMDNVIDRGFYPLPEQGREGRAKRRMGLGVTGVANAIEALGFPYGTPDFVACFDTTMEILANEVYFASAMLAKEKGAFALFDRDKFLSGKFIQTLGSDAKEAIGRYGIRNSHLLSVAPTGTISLCADNVSSGIEPVFAYEYERAIQSPDGMFNSRVTDYGLATFGVRGKPCSEVTIDEHLAVLLSAQKHVDSAVSKTCNIGDNVSFDEFKDVYVKAFEGGAKGCTTFRTSGKRMGILVEKKAEPAPTSEGEACRIDPVSGMKSCE